MVLYGEQHSRRQSYSSYFYMRVLVRTIAYFAAGHIKALTRRLVDAPVILIKIWEAVRNH